MSEINKTFIRPEHFLLIGIPGLEDMQIWFSIPLCLLYILNVFGNTIILYIILSEENLYKPMYFFLCMLSVIDLLGSIAITPKILCIFWFNSKEIGFNACLSQMFFIHALSMMESMILLAMAFDRYVAICQPLRYTLILTNQTIANIAVMAIIRGSILITPLIFLIKRLSFCRTNIISHTYCEHMAVVKIACSDITINQVYGLTVALLTTVFDIVCISLSYSVIIRAVMRLSSNEARHKVFSTCGSHICVIVIAYIPALFSFFTHRFGHKIPAHIHIIVANIYVLVPPMCNPIIYGVKTKEIQEKIILIFRKKNNNRLIN